MLYLELSLKSKKYSSDDISLLKTNLKMILNFLEEEVPIEEEEKPKN